MSSYNNNWVIHLIYDESQRFYLIYIIDIIFINFDLEESYFLIFILLFLSLL